jgi:hypothetical protein
MKLTNCDIIPFSKPVKFFGVSKKDLKNVNEHALLVPFLYLKAFSAS